MQMYEPTPCLSLAGSVAGEVSRAVGGSIRLLGAPDNHKAGCSGGQHTPDERDSRKNYSTAVEGRGPRLSGFAPLTPVPETRLTGGRTRRPRAFRAAGGHRSRCG